MRRVAAVSIVLALLAIGASASAARVPSYRNPVFTGRSFPDPMVLAVGDAGARRYFGYSTGDRFPVIRSDDLVHWTYLGLALARRPAWVDGEGDWHPWSPSVLERPDRAPMPRRARATCSTTRVSRTGTARSRSAWGSRRRPGRTGRSSPVGFSRT